MALKRATKRAGAHPRGAAAANISGDQVQSLVRALALLNRIAESPDEGATLTELAQQVGLPSSTAHRLLTTLEQERYVRFDHEGRPVVDRSAGVRHRLRLHQDPQPSRPR